MTEPKGVTQAFADLLSSWNPTGETVLETSRLLLIDGLAVALAGSVEGGPSRMTELARRDAAEPVATVIGHGYATSRAAAARINGMSMHALDYEPMWNPPNHAISPLLPALLAMAEQRERDGAPPQGQRLLEALAKGVEAQGRLRLASGQIEPESLRFHPPGVVGPLATAAACVHLLGGDAAMMARAMAIAASCGAGIIANIGSMTKALHCGNAAMRGLEAADLAHIGFTADVDPLGSPRGYGRAYFGDTFDPAPLVEPLQVPRMLEPGMAWKLFPSQYGTHFVLTAALDCRADIPDPARIRSVHVTSPRMAYVDRPNPDSGLAGKFSLQYCAAAALLDGRVDLDTYSDSRRFAPDMQALLPRVRLTQVDDISRRLDSMHVVVKVELDDGRTVEQRCEAPLGHWKRPVGPEPVIAKARHLTARFLPAPARETFWRCVEAPAVHLHVGTMMESLRVRA